MMTPSGENPAHVREFAHDRQITPRNNSGTSYVECPRTPENREAPRVNHLPRPKSDLSHRKEQESPVQAFVQRTCHRRSDSGFASREASTDQINVKEQSTASYSESYGKELPKTPTRNNAAFQDENKSRSASPKKCPSVDQRRLQSRYYRVRSPSMQRTTRVIFPTGDVDEIMSNTFGVELIR